MSNDQSTSKPQVMRVLQGEEAKQYLKKQQKKMMREFREWKSELCSIINRNSQAVINRDGTYQFILPSRLVKLIWATTIKERIRTEKVINKLDDDEARKAALDKLREEVETAHKEMAEGTLFENDKPDEKGFDEQKQKEAEEKAATEALRKFREEMIKEREANVEAANDTDIE